MSVEKATILIEQAMTAYLSPTTSADVRSILKQALTESEKLEAENKRLREENESIRNQWHIDLNDKTILESAISQCVGIIRASAQVSRKKLADMLENTLKGEQKC